MNKPVVGLIAGAVLGLIDGGTAWFTPEVRDQMASILVGSSMKGMLVGLASGFLARKVQSNAMGIAVGAALGLLLAWGVASMPDPQGRHYYVQIMVPGFITGAIIGYLTQTQGSAPQAARRGQRA